MAMEGCRLGQARLVAGCRLRHDAVRRNILCQPDIAADGRAATDRDPAQNGGTGVDHDIVLDDRMARVALDQLAFVIGGEMPGAEGDGLIDAHIVADDRGLADHDAGAVIDEETRSDAGARMDVDSRPGMGDLRDQACHQLRVQPVQDVGEPVMDDRGHAGIADQDLREIPGGGIADEGGAKVIDEKAAHGRQFGRKLARELDGVPAMKSGQQFVADEQGAAMNLFAEPLEGDTQRVTDEIVDVFPVEVEPAIVTRKQSFGQPVEDVFQGLAGRRAAGLAVAADAMGFLARYPQLGNDAIELPSLERRTILAGCDGVLIRRGDFMLHASPYMG
jgi:hypothetical protein